MLLQVRRQWLDRIEEVERSTWKRAVAQLSAGSATTAKYGNSTQACSSAPESTVGGQEQPASMSTQLAEHRDRVQALELQLREAEERHQLEVLCLAYLIMCQHNTF